LFGAPWLDAPALRDRLRAFDLPGIALRTTSFRPMFQKHAGRNCRGLQLHIRDRNDYDSVATGLAILSATLELHPDAFEWRDETYEFVDDRLAIDLLLGDVDMRHALESGANPLDVADRMSESRDEFEEAREACLFYERS
jgi:uncharacterized protein YbbC (DUF1343 family)